VECLCRKKLGASGSGHGCSTLKTVINAIFKLHVLGQLVALTLEFEQFLPLEAGLLSALEGNSIFWEMWEAWNLSAADVIATESGLHYYLVFVSGTLVVCARFLSHLFLAILTSSSFVMQVWQKI